MSEQVKLEALGYDDFASFNIDDEQSRRKVLSWLEDQIIGHLDIEERSGLRDVTSPNYQEAVDDYLNAIECPHPWSEKRCLTWIINFALRLAFEDEFKGEDAADSANLAPSTENSTNIDAVSSSLPKVDFTSNEWKEGIESLANELKVPIHPSNPEETLRAIHSVVKRSSDDESSRLEGVKVTKGAQYSLETCESLNPSDDKGEPLSPAFIQASRLLRLIQLNRLRLVQNTVNDAIVQAQAITAAPKTNPDLAT